MGVLEIDASHGEGGGQLTRCAMALAAIAGRPVHLRNIRAGRPTPGLMAQHLTALRAVAALSGGTLEADALGAMEVRFRPGPIRGGQYAFHVGTAGSVVLVLQAALPVALCADGPSRLQVTGGTEVKMAPGLDYLRLVFLPWLARMGFQARVDSFRRGYYPRGGGVVWVTVTPGGKRRPLAAEVPGRLREIRAFAHVARLPLHIPQRMAAAAQGALGGLGPLSIEARVLDEAEAWGTGGGMVLVARTEMSLLGASVAAQRGVAAERLGAEAGRALRADIEARAGVDLHASDQILIYAALACHAGGGPSRFAARELTLHARTMIWLIEQFLPVRFQVTPRDGLVHFDVRHG
jgi:RNA 3'-terminal phosphate cyclase (ATP)